MQPPCKTTFGLSARLALGLAASALSPVLVCAVCAAWLGAAPGLALACGAAAGLACAALCLRLWRAGLTGPLEGMDSAVKAFVTAGYRLERPLPKAGWPEPAGLASAFNRLALELGAYRGFHLNQVLEERSKAQALIETITDGVLICDDKGRLIYSNQRALNLLGIAKSTSIILPDSITRREFGALIAEIVSSRESSARAEAVLPGPEGEGSVARTYLVLARPFVLATLPAPGRVIVLRDVTVEKEIESARETLFHMITHDMRAPLASILGYAQMLERKLCAAGPDSEKYLQAIMRASKRLNGMVNDILTTIKLERGDMVLNPANGDAAALCRDVYEVHAPLAASKNVTLSAAVPEGPVPLHGDTALLERVLANLTGNALKFTPPGGAVSIGCRTEAGRTVFSVEDTGPGIPPDKREEIFEKYAQMEEHKYMGFGLGLAMCKMAVELHKGRIWVESEQGKGSRFIFVIPSEA